MVDLRVIYTLGIGEVRKPRQRQHVMSGQPQGLQWIDTFREPQKNQAARDEWAATRAAPTRCVFIFRIHHK
ncbi:MAG: hypothetical protein OXN25_07300 [Candidatus Poribacteria bacterium]|nr:hypothetical protein [Candidatus Poribacteria bacterium]